MSHKRRKLGQTGEDFATEYLEKKGYTLVTRNYRIRNGEIDIIARQKKVLVFIEVKTRKSSFLESPSAAVTQGKQRQISRAAQHYLSRYNLFDNEARFDVISIVIDSAGIPQIEHITNAFDLSFGF